MHRQKIKECMESLGWTNLVWLYIEHFSLGWAGGYSTKHSRSWICTSCLSCRKLEKTGLQLLYKHNRIWGISIWGYEWDHIYDYRYKENQIPFLWYNWKEQRVVAVVKHFFLQNLSMYINSAKYFIENSTEMCSSCSAISFSIIKQIG